MMPEADYDLAVVGGGINGAGIAAIAAVRGLKVFLCEQHDLASATSSASSKLIHGGLRYLENYEFNLVRQSLAERESLLIIAKHLVKPQAFIIPHAPKMRSRILIRLGLFIYDHLARKSILPKTKSIQLSKHLAGQSLKPQYTHAFQYFDCRTNDARLVIAATQKAAMAGATIKTYTRCIAAQQKSKHWEITLNDSLEQKKYTITARALINATGPWVDQFLHQQLKIGSKHHLALIKGSHIVIPKFYQGDFAYLLQNEDKRVIFVIPYQEKFLLVGTTDIVYDQKILEPHITEAEIEYLKAILQRYFILPSDTLDIVHSYSGIRPLLNDFSENPSTISREYLLEMTNSDPPLISVFGGKLTMFRSLSENSISMLQPYFPNMKPYSIANFVLPGSDYDTDEELTKMLQHMYPWLSSDLLKRYQNTYGTLTNKVLANCHNIQDLGTDFGGSLYQREVDYLIAEEWARSFEDILWRRTNLGYTFPKESISQLKEYLAKTL